MMKGFKDKNDFEQWAYTRFEEFNIPHPDTYTEEELIHYNPSVPVNFIKQHVKNRVRR